jgi:hypothetical protein
VHYRVAITRGKRRIRSRSASIAAEVRAKAPTLVQPRRWAITPADYDTRSGVGLRSVGTYRAGGFLTQAITLRRHHIPRAAHAGIVKLEDRKRELITKHGGLVPRLYDRLALRHDRRADHRDQPSA